MAATARREYGDRLVAMLLNGAWNLVWRHPRLVLWQLLEMFFSVALLGVGLVLAVMAVGLFVAQHELRTLSGWIEIGYDLVAIASDLRFWLGAGGVVFTLALLHLAFGAFFQAGLYGRLAAMVRDDSAEASWRGLLGAARDHFPALIGYAGMRLALTAILAIFTAITAVWPLIALAVGLWQGQGVAWWEAALCGLGMAASAALALLFYCWRMLALGPLMLEDAGVGEAFAVAFEALGQRLRHVLRLTLGAAVVVSPAVLTYGVFGVMAWLLGTRPDLTDVASALSFVLDLGLVLTIAGAAVFTSAAFLLEHAWHTKMTDTFPKARSEERPRVERALPSIEELFAKGEGALGVKLPESTPNRFAISSLFHFELEEPEVEPSPEEAEVAGASETSESAEEEALAVSELAGDVLEDIDALWEDVNWPSEGFEVDADGDDDLEGWFLDGEEDVERDD